MRITDASWMLLDSETTGVDDDAELLEIAAVRTNDAGDDLGDAFETFVRPTRPIPPQASAVHHLVDADVAHAPERPDVIAALESFVPPDAIIVAHCADFDRRMIAPALADRRWICSERLARHLAPDAPNFKNATLYYLLGGPKITTALHRAAGDLVVTRYVFARLLELYRGFASARCDGALDRLAKSELVDTLIAFAERPYEIRRMPFGKHRGQLLEEIPATYFRWALNGGMPDLDSDLRYNFERQLRLRRGTAA